MKWIFFLLLFPVTLFAQDLQTELIGTWEQTGYVYLPCTEDVDEAELAIPHDGEGILGLKRIRFEKEKVILTYENKPKEEYPYSIHQVGENGFSVKMKLKKKFLRKQKYKYLFCEGYRGGIIELNEWSNGCDSKEPTFYREIFYSMKRVQEVGEEHTQLLETWAVKIDSNYNLLAVADTIRLKKHAMGGAWNGKPLNGCLQILRLSDNQMCYGNACCISGCLIEGGTIQATYNRWEKRGTSLRIWNSDYAGTGLLRDVDDRFSFSMEGNELVLIRE